MENHLGMEKQWDIVGSSGVYHIIKEDGGRLVYGSVLWITKHRVYFRVMGRATKK